MKNKLFIFVLPMLVLAFSSCKDEADEPEPSVISPEIKVEITNITDSGADISLKRVGGLISTYKIVAGYPVSDLTSPDNEDELKTVVGEKGLTVTVPYSGKATGLHPDTEYISIAVGYGSTGNPICVHSVVFSTKELAGTISNENSAGELNESVW